MQSQLEKPFVLLFPSLNYASSKNDNKFGTSVAMKTFHQLIKLLVGSLQDQSLNILLPVGLVSYYT